jgi:hypothetical protein
MHSRNGTSAVASLMPATTLLLKAPAIGDPCHLCDPESLQGEPLLIMATGRCCGIVPTGSIGSLV